MSKAQKENKEKKKPKADKISLRPMYRLTRRRVAQSHTPCNRCVRFATTVASGHATLATKRTLLPTWAGLSPAGSHQLCAGAPTRSPRRRAPAVYPAR